MSGREAVVGSLVVNVLAVTKQFREGLGHARKELKEFSASAGAVGKSALSLKGLLISTFAGFSVRAAASEFLSIANGLDSVAEAAKRVGISAGSLQALSFAGKMSGVEAGTIERSLIKMQRGISEVAKGSGSAKDALRELHLSAIEMKSWGADRQLLAVAAAMQGVTDQADKLRLAVDLFGKSGADMLPMLSGGASELRGFLEEAKQLGIVFDAKEVEKVEKMNDALDKLRAVFGSFGQGLVIEAAPSLLQAAKDLKDAAIGFRLQREKGSSSALTKAAERAAAPGTTLVQRWIDAATSLKVRRDIRNGVASGSPAFEGISRGVEWHTDIRGNRFMTTDETTDEQIAFREQMQARAKLLAIYKQRGFNALEAGMTSLFGPTDPEARKKWKGNETLLELAKSIKGFQDMFSDNLIKYSLKAMVERPGDAAFNARRREILELRAKSREFQMQEEDRKLEEAKRKQEQQPDSRSANEALLRGTAEAYRAIAENKYPKLQLDAAKQANRHLAAIERNLQFAEVGIG